MAKQEKIEDLVEYKNKVVFLRKSRAGKHLFVFDSREDLVAGSTLIFDVSEVERLIGGGTDWIKVSVLPASEAGGSAKEEGDKTSSSDSLLFMVKRAEEEEEELGFWL